MKWNVNIESNMIFMNRKAWQGDLLGFCYKSSTTQITTTGTNIKLYSHPSSLIDRATSSRESIKIQLKSHIALYELWTCCKAQPAEREKKATNRKNPLCYRCWLDVLQWCFDKNNSFGTKVVIFSLTKKGRDPQSQEYTHELLQAVLFGNKCTHFLRWAHLCADDSPMDILYKAPTSYKENTLLSMMKGKLSQQRFWPWLETGSSRGFQHCPATYLWVLSRVTFTVDYQ